MGDKTQLLAFVLASRFRKPWAIFAGILVATILNHLLAAFSGNWLSQTIPSTYLKWILGGIFFAFSAWLLIPDKDVSDKNDSSKGNSHLEAFITTLITFFLAEMGDKTQLSTVALAAKYQNIFLVTIGTTLGMMFSDGLAVFFGDKILEIIPMKWVRIFACLLFIAFGIGIIIGY